MRSGFYRGNSYSHGRILEGRDGGRVRATDAQDTKLAKLAYTPNTNHHTQDTITLKLKLTQAFISFDLICNRVRQFASCAAALPGAIQWPLRMASPSRGLVIRLAGRDW